MFAQAAKVPDTACRAHPGCFKHFECYAASLGRRSGIFNPGRSVGLKVVGPFQVVSAAGAGAAYAGHILMSL